MKKTPNIGWLYFKDYYAKLHRNDLNVYIETCKIKKEQPKFGLKDKNEYIFQQKLDDHEQGELLKVDMPNIKTFNVRTEYPGLITGTGITHDFSHEDALKLGFSFDHTTGLPYIPASSVKGMLRAYFPSRMKKHDADKAEAMYQYLIEHLFVNPKFKLTQKLTESIIDRLEENIFEGYGWIKDEEKNITEWKRISIYQRDIFFDAYPQFSGYEGTGGNDAGRFLGEGVITPHGTDPLKDPTPIKFLKILPNVAFSFQFQLHDVTIDGITINATQKCMLFRELLTQFGIGAKTNVGFGQMV